MPEQERNAIATALKQLRNERGLTQEELGRRVGMDVTQISKRESGKVRVNPQERRLFATALGVTLADFDSRWRSSAVHRSKGGPGIPVINRAPAGIVIDYEEYGVDSGQGLEYLDPHAIDDDLAFAVIVVGDSMEPTLYENDYLILSPMNVPRPRASLVNGSVVFVRFTPESQRSGCVLARWFTDDEGAIELRKDNDAYPALKVQREEIQQLAVAIQKRSRKGL